MKFPTHLYCNGKKLVKWNPNMRPPNGSAGNLLQNITEYTWQIYHHNHLGHGIPKTKQLPGAWNTEKNPCYDLGYLIKDFQQWYLTIEIHVWKSLPTDPDFNMETHSNPGHWSIRHYNPSLIPPRADTYILTRLKTILAERLFDWQCFTYINFVNLLCTQCIGHEYNNHKEKELWSNLVNVKSLVITPILTLVKLLKEYEIMGHVPLVAITGTTIQEPCHVVKSLRPSWMPASDCIPKCIESSNTQ